EDHLSYTTLTRLAECCREHYWATAIVPAAAGIPLDAIARELQARFHRPVFAGAKIWIACRVHAVRSRRGTPVITGVDPARAVPHATFTLECVFYDPVGHRAVAAPPGVRTRLEQLAAASTGTSDATSHGRGMR